VTSTVTIIHVRTLAAIALVADCIYHRDITGSEQYHK